MTSMDTRQRHAVPSSHRDSAGSPTPAQRNGGMRMGKMKDLHAMRYQHTHYSRGDGSPAMMVSAEPFVLMNEDGYAWADDPAEWAPIHADAEERARRERLRELFWIPAAMGALIGVPIGGAIFAIVWIFA